MHQIREIDQVTFLDIRETFRMSSDASSWLNAIDLASPAASSLPDMISMAVSIALMKAVTVAS